MQAAADACMLAPVDTSAPPAGPAGASVIECLIARMRETAAQQLRTEVDTRDGVPCVVTTTGLESAINNTPFDRCASREERVAMHARACRAVAAHTRAEIDAFDEGWSVDWTGREGAPFLRGERVRHARGVFFVEDVVGDEAFLARAPGDAFGIALPWRELVRDLPNAVEHEPALFIGQLANRTSTEEREEKTSPPSVGVMGALENN